MPQGHYLWFAVVLVLTPMVVASQAEAQRHSERNPDERLRPKVEVVIPLEVLPQAGAPATPASPAAPVVPDEPLMLDCRDLAERIVLLRDGGVVGTRQLRERRELEARYRRACR